MSILGIGTVVVDHSVLLPEHPECDTKNTVSRHWKQVGGPVPVALSTAAFYGSACRFLSRWGNDEPGRYVTQELTDRGIDISSSTQHDNWETGFAQVWTVPDGRRTIAYSRGEFPLPSVSDFSSVNISNCRILHLDGWAGDIAVAAAKAVNQAGGIVVLDAGSVKPCMDELLPLADILIASSLFRKSRFGTADVEANQLIELGCDSVITTHGSDGATWITADSKLHQPGFKVNAIDTNGAGDIFSGALISKLIDGTGNAEALEFATAVSAVSCCSYGNNSLPTLSEVAALRGRQ